MRTVAFERSGLRTSALGYGTSRLMNRLGRSDSRRLLEVAFDSGITHFDTARLYGAGEAESVVGQFAHGRRDRMTIATKFGIEPPRRTVALQALKAVARAAIAAAPALRGRVARVPGLIKRGRFDVPSALRSLETSLRELKTDYVDILFLHDCTPADLQSNDLLAFLESVHTAGAVRAFGIATDPATVRAALAAASPFAGVVQLPQPWQDRLATALPDHDSDVIVHSVVANAAQTARLLPADVPPERIGGLLLAHALARNPGAIALVGSTSEAHIRANARAVDELGPRSPELIAFSRVLAATTD